jgi:hypothetical protein
LQFARRFRDTLGMALFIIIREGETSEDGDDLLVVDDAQLVCTLGSLIARRLGVGSTPRPLRSIADRPLSEPDTGEQGRGDRPTATSTAREEVVLSE